MLNAALTTTLGNLALLAVPPMPEVTTGDLVNALNCGRAELFNRCRPEELCLKDAKISGVKEMPLSLHGVSLAGVRLSCLTISFAELNGADLSQALVLGSSLSDVSLKGANLDGAVIEASTVKAGFSGCSMRGAKISCYRTLKDDQYARRHTEAPVDLRGSVFAGSNLTGIIIVSIPNGVLQCSLKGVNFEEAILDSLQYAGHNRDSTIDFMKDSSATVAADAAVFKGCSINNSDFRLFNLINAQFSGARGEAPLFAGVEMIKADFSGARLGRPDFSGANLMDAVFSGQNTQIRSGKFENANIMRCNFSGADLTGSIFSGEKLIASGANFTGCNMQQVIISSPGFCNVILKNADLRGANLTRAWLNQSDLSGADLTDTDLWFAQLQGADLRGAKVTAEQLKTVMSLKGAKVDEELKRDLPPEVIWHY